MARSSSSRGWIVTVAGLCINLALGVLYTWSIFTSKFTTVIQMGANGAVQQKGEALAGAAPIAASKAAEFGLKLADGMKVDPGFFVSAETEKGSAIYKTVKVAATVLKDSAFNWKATDALMPYALALLFFAFTMVFAGRLQDKFGPRWVATVGGLFVGAGMIIASFAQYNAGGNHLPLVLGFGVMTGIGIGLAYACATPAAVKWFHPSKRGLISGLVVAGFGAASIYTAPLTTQMIGSVGISGTFRALGVAFLVAICLLAQLLQNPPADYTPAVPANFKEKETPKQAAIVAAQRDFAPGQMTKTPQFYLLWIMYACAAFAGLMIVGLIAKVAPEIVTNKDQLTWMGTGLGALAPGFILVMALAIGNGLGRPIIGIVSDRIGRVPSMMIIFLSQAVLVGFLLQRSNDLFMLLGVAALIGAMYGANLALFPAATYDFFGTKHGGVNYGMVFTAWGVGGALGSYAAGWIKDATGAFTGAYYLAAGLCVLATILAVTVKAPRVAEASAPSPELEAA